MTRYSPLRKPPVQIPLSQYDTLVRTINGSNRGRLRPCINAGEREGTWTAEDVDSLKDFVSAESGFLSQLGQICIRAKIRSCFHDRCLIQRSLVEGIAPKCNWESFGDWAIEAVSCQLNMRKGQRAREHISTAIKFCRGLLDCYYSKEQKIDGWMRGDGDTRRAVNVAEVCDVIYWMMLVQDHIDGINISDKTRWPLDFVPEDFIEPGYNEAMRLADKMKFCRNQVRRLQLVTPRDRADMLAVMEYANTHPGLQHEKHTDCVKSWCFPGHQDSTIAERYHVHDEYGIPCSGYCGQVPFTAQKLMDALDSGKPTAWRNDGTGTLDKRHSFIAISHVWADGTGGDKERPLHVYSCILDFWRRLSKQLDCKGIWWDAISVPGRPDDPYREKALSQMHDNYVKAKYTIVHDRYLLNFEYKDPSSACLAVVLSPWFTRAWTALELRMSGTDRVKVLFKGPHPGRPVMKSLDEILDCDPAYDPRPHIIAHSMIRRLRNDIETVTDLLAILKPRYWSWPPDIKKISGLLVDWIDYDPKGSEADFTMGIIREIREVEISALYHGFETINKRGRFSWCPHSLRDMPIRPTAEFDDPALDELRLTYHNGSVEGKFYYRFLVKEDEHSKHLKQLQPSIPDTILSPEDVKSFTPTQRAAYSEWMKNVQKAPKDPKVSKAANKQLLGDGLRNWQSCLLLRANEQTSAPAILVKTVGIGPSKIPQEMEVSSSKDRQEMKEPPAGILDTDEEEIDLPKIPDIIDCRYVVAVNDETLRGRDPSLWRKGEFSMGRDEERDPVDARKLLEKFRKKK